MKRFILIFLFLFLIPGILLSQEDSIKVASQNPSPMEEYTRTHDRIKQLEYKGLSFTIGHLLWKPVEVYIPRKSIKARKPDLLIHFHGGSSLPAKYAAEMYSNGSIIAASLSLGSGSRLYYNQFNDTTLFQKLLDSIRTTAEAELGHRVEFRTITLSGFSAGYGSIKRIISSENYYNLIDNVILLDGIHSSYIPDRKVIYEGGKIDTSAYDIFLKLAKDASNKGAVKRFLITHSEVFPGTFVSTTEASDYLIREMGLRRKPILKWGPFGMQQLSDTRYNNFRVMGFAGNSGPDHVDHFHSLYFFLNQLR